MSTSTGYKDAYYNDVLGQSEESLIELKSDGTVDDSKTKNKILKEIERLSRLITEQSSSISLSGECTKNIDKARELLSATTLEAAKTVQYLEKVKQRLIRAYESREAKQKWFAILLIYNLVFFAIFTTLIVTQKLIPGQSSLDDTILVCLACAAWGGIGGVIDAFCSMHMHFSKQDFDTRFLPWYFLHPILGVSLGAVIFLILQAGLLTVSQTTLKEGETSSLGTTALPIAFAIFAGFRQNVALDFISRIIRTIFQNEESTS